jgi:hypothetical protein
MLLVKFVLYLLVSNVVVIVPKSPLDYYDYEGQQQKTEKLISYL